MFHSFTCLSDVDNEIKDEVADNLGTLQTEFKSYFPELSPDAFTLERNPFRVAIEQVDDQFQDELIDLRNDSGCRDVFEDVSVTEFWIQVSSSYPQISRNYLMKLLPFTTMWLCESAFSSLTSHATDMMFKLISLRTLIDCTQNTKSCGQNTATTFSLNLCKRFQSINLLCC